MPSPPEGRGGVMGCYFCNDTGNACEQMNGLFNRMYEEQNTLAKERNEALVQLKEAKKIVKATEDYLECDIDLHLDLMEMAVEAYRAKYGDSGNPKDNHDSFQIKDFESEEE